MHHHNFTSIPSHFGETRVSQDGLGDGRMMEPITQTNSYRNYLSAPVSIAWRNGFKFHLNPEHNLYQNCFIAKVRICIGPEVKVDADRLFSAMNAQSSSELRAIREAYEIEVKVNSYRGATIVLDYPLTLEQLQSYGGSVYFSELDIVVSLLPVEEMPAHPYSEEGRTHQTVAGSPVDHGGVGFGYAVEIIDNYERFGTRYLNIGGAVYPVRPKKDVERRDGVYIISNYAANGTLTKEGVKVSFCSFDKAEEELGLYKSFDEALHLGNIAQAHKREMLTMEHDLAKGKVELQNLKNLHDREMLTATQELKRIEQENARLDARNKLLENDLSLERQRIKDYYEQKSYQRKDTSEALKILPTLLMGLTTLMVAIKTFFGTPTVDPKGFSRG